jgi:hypothetical protein
MSWPIAAAHLAQPVAKARGEQAAHPRVRVQRRVAMGQGRCAEPPSQSASGRTGVLWKAAGYLPERRLLSAHSLRPSRPGYGRPMTSTSRWAAPRTYRASGLSYAPAGVRVHHWKRADRPAFGWEPDTYRAPNWRSGSTGAPQPPGSRASVPEQPHGRLHLRHIFWKLDVSSPVQLAGLVAKHRPERAGDEAESDRGAADIVG